MVNKWCVQCDGDMWVLHITLSTRSSKIARCSSTLNYQQDSKIARCSSTLRSPSSWSSWAPPTPIGMPAFQIVSIFLSSSLALILYWFYIFWQLIEGQIWCTGSSWAIATWLLTGFTCHTYWALWLFNQTDSELVTRHAGVHLLVNFIDWCYEQKEQCDGLYIGLECRRSGRVAISA